MMLLPLLGGEARRHPDHRDCQRRRVTLVVEDAVRRDGADALCLVVRWQVVGVVACSHVETYAVAACEHYARCAQRDLDGIGGARGGRRWMPLGGPVGERRDPI